MASAEAPPHNAAVIEKLIKQHGDRLHPQESFVSALRCGAVDSVQPGAVFGMLGAIGRRMERSLSEDEIETRAPTKVCSSSSMSSTSDSDSDDDEPEDEEASVEH